MNAFTTNPYAQFLQPAGVPTAFPQAAPVGVSTALPQPMTMPTIHADIIQTDDDGYIDRYPLGTGQAQMFITTDESRITIKSANDGGTSKAVYERKEKQNITPEFVRRDEIDALIEAAIAKRTEASE